MSYSRVLSLCMSSMLALVWVLTYVSTLYVCPMCMFLLFPISWDLWSGYSGHFLRFVIRIFCVWCFLVNHSNIPEPCERHTGCPVYKAPVNHAVPTSISVWVLGLLSALLWPRSSSCGGLPLLGLDLLSPSLFTEGFNFRFLLFPVLIPGWLPWLSSKTFLRIWG